MTASPDSIVGRIAQQIRLVYQSETGEPLFAGLAEKMAQAAATDLVITEEHRTLTDGWVRPMGYGVERTMALQWSREMGLPYADPHPNPEIREESRWVTEWAVTAT